MSPMLTSREKAMISPAIAFSMKGRAATPSTTVTPAASNETKVAGMSPRNGMPAASSVNTTMSGIRSSWWTVNCLAML